MALDRRRGFWARFYYTFRFPLLIALVIMLIGSVGFWVVSGYQASVLDCVYMTFITVATIGFGETIDLTYSPGGRIFTMFIATLGIANVTFVTSQLTAFIIESRFDEYFRRRRMHEQIDALKNHYIICGVGRVGGNVAHELAVTGRPFVAVEDAAPAVDAFKGKFPNVPCLHGDSSDDSVLDRAGLKRAVGLFAVTGDDSKNLLITLTAKQVNPAIRVVARCHEIRNMDKLRRVGADAIVSPDFTGGMRIASSMIRPVVVGFLDEMLRSDTSLRVEEIRVPESAAPRTVAALAPGSREYILLAVKSSEGWEFNPAADREVVAGEVLVAMCTPNGRAALEKRVGT